MKTFIAYANRSISTRKEINGVVYGGRSLIPMEVPFQAPEDMDEGSIRSLGESKVKAKWKSAWLECVLPEDAPKPKMASLHELGYV